MSDLRIESVMPWAPHPTAAPLSERRDDLLVVAANGTRTCIGGWQLVYSGVVAGETYSIQVDAGFADLDRVQDQLRCELYWGELPADEPRNGHREVVSWDYLVPESGSDDSTRFTRIVKAPEGADRLTLRYTLRWSRAGSAHWHLPQIDRSEAAEAESAPVRICVVTGRSEDRQGPYRTIEENIDFYLPLCRQTCAEATPDLIVLPEIALQWGLEGSPLDLAVPAPGPETAPFAELARRCGVYLLLGLLERDGDAVHNSAVLIGPDGTIVGKYRKVHLAVGGEMETGILPGDDFPVFDTAIGRVGCNICMDSSAAESSRMIGLNGADFLLLPIMGDHRAWHPENHVWDPERFKGIMMTRAVDNQLCMVVAVNRARGTCIIDRTGHVLAWNDGDRPYVSATVVLNDGFRPANKGCYRSTNWMQRRPHAYSAFVDPDNLGGLLPREY